MPAINNTVEVPNDMAMSRGQNPARTDDASSAMKYPVSRKNKRDQPGPRIGWGDLIAPVYQGIVHSREVADARLDDDLRHFGAAQLFLMGRHDGREILRFSKRRK